MNAQTSRPATAEAAMPEAAELMTSAASNPNPPTPEQVETARELSRAFTELTALVLTSCPPGRRRSTALTQLETALMFAGKSVYCDG